MKNILKNFSYTISSNLSTMVLSTCIIFIIPKLVDPVQYGYFQIFTFYFSYAGIVQFGWLDGIYLRYGGVHYKKLDKALFKGQQYSYIISQVLILLMIFLYYPFVKSFEYKFIIIAIAYGIFFANLKNFYQIILQMTNRISEFAISNIIASGSYAILLILFIMIGCRNYHYYIVSNVIGQFISLCYGIFVCKELFINRVKSKFSYKESIDNIYSGSKISFAGIAAMLILGVVRLGIQKEWSVQTFGRVSLVLSVSNLLMLFINAASMVLFPVIRRITTISIVKLYNATEELFLPILFFLLLIFYPVYILIYVWLPDYRTSLIFLAFLFPLGLYQGKFEVLTNTFFKSWRMENSLLFINAISLIFASILTFIFAYFIHSLKLTVFTIILSMMFRSFLAELIVKKKLKDHSWGFFIVESVLVSIFILSNILLNVFLSFIIYLLSYITYYLINHSQIIRAVSFLKNIKYDTEP